MLSYDKEGGGWGGVGRMRVWGLRTGCQVPHLCGHWAYCEHPQKLEKSVARLPWARIWVFSKSGTLWRQRSVNGTCWTKGEGISRSHVYGKAEVLCKLEAIMVQKVARGQRDVPQCRWRGLTSNANKKNRHSKRNEMPVYTTTKN